MTKKTIVALMGIFITGFVIASVFVRSRPVEHKPVPVPTGSGFSSWESVIPGKTTYDELLQTKGQPVASTGGGQSQRLEYPTSNEYWYTDVIIQSGTVTFVRERLFSTDERSLRKRLDALTEKPVVLYGPEAVAGQYLYAFPLQGIAYLADENADKVYEAWRFPGMPFENFMLLEETIKYSTTITASPE